MSGFRDPDSTPPTPDDMLDLSATSPTSPGSAGSSQASTPLDPCGPTSPKDFSKRVPSLRSTSDPTNLNPMNPTSTSQGVLHNARMPVPQPQTGLSAEHLAKTRAFLQSRMGTSPKMSANSSPGQTPKPGTPITAQIPTLQGGVPNLSNGFNPMKMSIRPGPGGASSAPAVPKALGLGARRGLKLPMGDNPVTASTPSPSMNGMKLPSQAPQPLGSFNEFSKYIDTEHGYLKFDEARVFDKGVEFADGEIFSISLDEIEVLDELGKGNYGTVYKVKHAKPTMPRFGPGLSGFRQKPPRPPSFMNGRPPTNPAAAPHLRQTNGTTGRVMAMKEIRLELDEQKFKNILKELIILHRCSSPYIIDFYGAFFQEGSVYMCIEYMDGGSIDKLYSWGISEGVLKKITYATISGLLELKEKHQIIHRDVKPTNILANTSGQVKICDFGVSGNLVASKAMTNIGCQSYMAPERISGGALAVGLETSDGSYDVTSDIWSLGLSIIECATGRYPYPPEVSSSILGQLNAIVEGDPPDMPSEGFSNTAREFVKACLNKVPSQRPTYKGLLQHSWLASLSKPGTIAEEDEESGLAKNIDTMSITASAMETGDKEVADWVKTALAKNHEKEAQGQSNGNAKKPALHTAPLAL